MWRYVSYIMNLIENLINFLFSSMLDSVQCLIQFDLYRRSLLCSNLLLFWADPKIVSFMLNIFRGGGGHPAVLIKIFFMTVHLLKLNLGKLNSWKHSDRSLFSNSMYSYTQTARQRKHFRTNVNCIFSLSVPKWLEKRKKREIFNQILNWKMHV